MEDNKLEPDKLEPDKLEENTTRHIKRKRPESPCKNTQYTTTNDMNATLFAPLIQQMARLQKLGYSWHRISKELNVSEFRLRGIRKKYKDLLNPDLYTPNEHNKQLENGIINANNLVNNHLTTQSTLDDYNKQSNSASKTHLCQLLQDIAHNTHETSANRTQAIKLLSELLGYNKQAQDEQPRYTLEFIEFKPASDKRKKDLVPSFSAPPSPSNVCQNVSSSIISVDNYSNTLTNLTNIDITLKTPLDEVDAQLEQLEAPHSISNSATDTSNFTTTLALDDDFKFD